MNIWSFPIYSMACWLTVWLVGAGNGWLYFVAFASLLCCYRCTRCPHAHKYIFLYFFLIFSILKQKTFKYFNIFFLSLFLNTRDIVLLLHTKLQGFSAIILVLKMKFTIISTSNSFSTFLQFKSVEQMLQLSLFLH